MKNNAVATVATDAARFIIDNKLVVRSMAVHSTSSIAGVTPPVVEVDVAQDPRAVLAWARFLNLDTVKVERRPEDVTLKLVATRENLSWVITGSFKKQDNAGPRNRFPGITVTWERREIGGSRTARGTITTAQLDVLIGQLGA